MSRSWADVWPPSPPVSGGGQSNNSVSSVTVSSRVSSNPWAEAVRPMMRSNTNEAEPAESWSRSSYDRPPHWDGTQPETQLAAYMKALQA
eukprot:5739385-Amphidinium_carterae.1